MKQVASKHGSTIARPVTWPRLTRGGLVANLLHIDAVYRQRRDLMRLDDHLLKDIGLTRHDVHRMMGGRARVTRTHE